MTIDRVGSENVGSPIPGGMRAAGPGSDDGGGLGPARLARIQSWRGDGRYDSPEIAGEVARRLLDSGDLDLRA